MKKKLPPRAGGASPSPRVGAQNPPPRVGAQNPHLRVGAKAARKVSTAPAGKAPAVPRESVDVPRRGSRAAARRETHKVSLRGAGAAALRLVDGMQRPVLGAAVLVLALAAAWLTGFADRPVRVWRGYETLLIRSDIAQSGGLLKVVNALGPGVVSELTATVNFWDFTGVESVPVARIDMRIDPSDPRHDKTMEGLPSYFRSASGRAGGWSIAYIPSHRAAAIDYLKVAAVLGFPFLGNWRMAELDAIELMISAAGLLGLAAFLAYPFRREGRTRLLIGGAGALLWVPFLIPGGVARIALAFFLLASWFRVVEVFSELRGSSEKLLREARSPLVRFVASAGMGLVLFFPATGFSADAFVGYAGPVAACVLVMVALAIFWGRPGRLKGRRKKFDPVPIVKTAADPARGRAGFFMVLLVIAAVAGIALARSAPVPTPLPVFGARDFSWQSLARLAREKRVPRLPDISDFVTHEAFQQSIAFGRPWRLPEQDERVYLREFSTNARAGSIIVEGFRRVKVFDSTWLDSVTRRFAPGSIEGMLISQGGSAAVAYRGQVEALLRELPIAVLVLFFFSSWFALDRRAAPLMKNVLVRLNGPARRNQVQ